VVRVVGGVTVYVCVNLWVVVVVVVVVVGGGRTFVLSMLNRGCVLTALANAKAASKAPRTGAATAHRRRVSTTSFVCSASCVLNTERRLGWRDAVRRGVEFTL
jgi:hypothetical protein